MAKQFDPNKYKKIFELRYGKGSYDKGIRKASESGRLSKQSQLAKKDYTSELKKLSEEAKKHAEEAIEIYEETSSATPKDIENAKGNKPKSLAYANKQLRLHDPEAAQDIALQKAKEAREAAKTKPDKSKEKAKKRKTSNMYVDPDTQTYYNQKQKLDDFYNRLDKISESRNKKSREEGEKFLNKNPRLVKEYTRMGGKKMMPTEKDYKEQKRIYEATKAYDAKHKSKKKSKKKKKEDGIWDDVKSATKATKEFFNPFDDVSQKEALDKFLGKKKSKSTAETSRFLNRAVDSTTLGAMSNLDKKLNKRQPTYTKAREFGKGGGTDMISSGLGYLAPGAGAVKGARALGVGAKSAKGAKKYAQIAKEGAIVGGALGAGEVGIREGLNPKDYNWKENAALIGMGVAGGAFLDPAIHGAGALGLKGLSKYAKGDVPTYTGKIKPSTLSKMDTKTPEYRATGSQANSSKLYDRIATLKNPEHAAPAEKSLAISPSKQKDYGLIKVSEANIVPTNKNIKIHNPKELVKKQIDTKGAAQKEKISLDKIKTAMVDDFHPVKKATQELGGKDIKTEDNPYIVGRMARGAAGKAETYLQGGIYTPDGQKVGKSLKEIIKPTEKKVDDFIAYITSKRAIDYDEKGLVAGIKPKDVEGISDRQLAEATIKQIEAESPEFKQIQQDLVKYTQDVMKQLEESGYYTKEALEKIFEDNPNYVSMQRVQDPKVRGFQPLSHPSRKFASLTNPIKSRTGSTKPIVNPIESTIKNTYVITNIAERNKVANTLLKLIENAPENNSWGRVVGKNKHSESIDDLMTTLDEAIETQDRTGKSEVIDNLFRGEGNKVYAYRNGEKVEMELQDDLYKAMLSLDSEQQNFLIKMLSIPARVLREGAVLSPDFGAVNIFRDQLSAHFNSKYGYKPFIDMLNGLASVLKKDDFYWQWRYNGGANSVLASLSRDYLQKDLRSMIKYPFGNRLKYGLTHPVDTVLKPLRTISEISEEATRVGEFKKGLKKGATPMEAAFSSRDLMDFLNSGYLGKTFNQITAFYNAAVQSMNKLLTTIKEDPAGSTVRAMMSITLPSVVLYVYNHDQEWYKELPQRERDLYWHFKVGNQIYKLPKPFEAGILYGTAFERTLDALVENDPEAFKGFAKTVADAFTPNWIPTAIQPWIEAYANKSITFDSPIVPRREEDLLPEDQYGAYQSELSKAVGKFTEKSPRKIEHVFRGYTGGLGKYFLNLTDFGHDAFAKGQPELPDRGLADKPIVNRFVVKNLEGNNQSINDFYERLDRLKRESKSADKNNKMNPNADIHREFNSLNKSIGELQKEKRAILDDPYLTGKEKAEEIKRLDKMITAIAKEGNSLK